MVPLPDNHGMQPAGDQGIKGGMRLVDQGTSGFLHFETQFTELAHPCPGRAMRGDEDAPRRDVRRIVPGEDAVAPKGFHDGGIMDEVAQDGDGAAGGGVAGVADGVPDSEAPAEVVGTLDSHDGLRCKVNGDDAGHVGLVGNRQAGRAL